MNRPPPPLPTGRIIVCGGRQYADQAKVDTVLDTVHKTRIINMVVHGQAPGADTLADFWAYSRGLPREPHPADWARYGNSAGPRRNEEMAKAGADLLVAFPGGHGTAGMIRLAKHYHIPVQEVT